MKKWVLAFTMISSAFLLGCSLETPDGESVTGAERAVSRFAPTAPKNLQVTGFTSYSVSLAWGPSTGGSGGIMYRVRHGWGYEKTTDQTQFTWTGNVEPRYSYSFYVYAVDSRGRKSGNSNTVTVRLPADTVPPAKPSLGLTAAGPSFVTLAWSSMDDGPFIWFTLFKDGSPWLTWERTETAIVAPLSPETSYTFTVQARDQGNNLSPVSDAVTVTTPPADASDTIPPTAPGNLTDNGMSFPDGETWLFWDQSTDNVDPQSVIQYEISVNGKVDHVVAGWGSTIVYGDPGVTNTYQVVAIDAAGNRSASAILVTDAF